MKIFMVFDGMGGAENGEVASKLACRGFVGFFRKHPVVVPEKAYLDQALRSVEDQFDAYIAQHPASLGMGTTFTMLWVHERGITCAYIGDSRIYRLRSGLLTRLTKDHSLVNKLLEAGLIDDKAAASHPKRNVITRAIQGAGKGRTQMDVIQIDDVLADDLYFLCTDGLTDVCPDELLESILGKDMDLEQRIQLIREECARKANDNYTAYFIPIQDVFHRTPAPSEKSAGPEEITVAMAPSEQTERSSRRSAKKGPMLGWGLFIILLIGFIYWTTRAAFYPEGESSKIGTPPPNTDSTSQNPNDSPGPYHKQ